MDALSLVLPVALAAGINLYLTVFALGLALRLNVLETLPAGLDVLGSVPVLVFAGFMVVLEFFADKIPVVDLVWNTIHTLIRPVGAVLLASGLLVDADPATRAVLILVAGGASLATHSSKTGLRALVTTSPEPVSNAAISFGEDIGVLTLMLLAVRFPTLTLVLSLLLLLALMWAAPQLWRFGRYWLRGFFARFESQLTDSETLPDRHRAHLDRAPRLTVACRAQGIRGANGSSGYLSLSGNSLLFTFDRWFGRVGLWQTDYLQIARIDYRRGLLLDTLFITVGEGDDAKNVRFTFTKDRAKLAAILTAKLSADAPVGALAAAPS